LIKNNSPDSATTVYSLMKKIVRFVNEKDCEIEVSSSFFGDDVTIFAVYNGSLLLKRNGKVGNILQAESDIKIIEGKKVPEDIFVLMTNSSLEFKGEIFQKLSQGLDADTTVASIVPGVQNLENSSLTSMAFLSDLPEDYDNGSEKSDSSLEWFGPEEKEESVIEFSDDDQSKSVIDKEDEKSQPIFEAQTGKKKFKFDKKKLISLLILILTFLKKTIKVIFIIIKKIFIFFKQLFTNEVYVDEGARIAKKRLRILVLSVIAVLLILVPFFIFKLRADAHVKDATQQISSLMTEFEEVKTQVEENPIESREKIAGIIDNLQSKEKSFANKEAGKKYILSQLTLVQEYFDSISGKEVFNELEVFFDFQLVESDFIASRTKLSEDIAYFFDKDKKKLIKLELGSKKVEVIDLGEQEDLTDFVTTKEKIFLLGNGILERGLTSDSVERIIDQGKSNEGAKLISIFSDNIYVLNHEQRNIYKYSYDSSNSEYSDPIRWVKSAKDLEFDKVVSMVVDGNIWLSTRLGQVFKLNGGEGSSFDINGLAQPLSDQTYLFTHSDYDNIYLLEPSSNRLIVITKGGDFVKEIKSASLAAASGLVVSESLNKAIVISGSLVFEVGL